MLWCKQNVAGRKLNTEDFMPKLTMYMYIIYKTKVNIFYNNFKSMGVFRIYLYEQLNCITSHFFKIYCTLTFEGLFPATAEVQDKD